MYPDQDNHWPSAFQDDPQPTEPHWSRLHLCFLNRSILREFFPSQWTCSANNVIQLWVTPRCGLLCHHYFTTSPSVPSLLCFLNALSPVEWNTNHSLQICTVTHQTDTLYQTVTQNNLNSHSFHTRSFRPFCSKIWPQIRPNWLIAYKNLPTPA